MGVTWLDDIKHYFKQRLTLQESLVFLFFLALASLIWYGHAMNSVRNAMLGVSVSYKGIPDNIVFSDTLPDVIYVEVRDAGKRLKSYGNHLEVSFDLSNQIIGHQGEVNITTDLIRNSITTILQGTTKLQNIQPEQISGNYYRQQSKEVPIRLVASPSPAAQYQLVGDPKITPSKITIYGQKAQLDSIHFIATIPLTVSEIKDTLQVTATLSSPAGIRLADNHITVTYIAEQFTEKVLTMPITAHGVPAATHLRLFPSEAAVHLRVGVSHFNEVSERDVHLYCEYPHAPVEKLPVIIQCTNPYVTFSRCTPASVEFLIEK